MLGARTWLVNLHSYTGFLLGAFTVFVSLFVHHFCCCLYVWASVRKGQVRRCCSLWEDLQSFVVSKWVSEWVRLWSPDFCMNKDVFFGCQFFRGQSSAMEYHVRSLGTVLDITYETLMLDQAQKRYVRQGVIYSNFSITKCFPPVFLPASWVLSHTSLTSHFVIAVLSPIFGSAVWTPNIGSAALSPNFGSAVWIPTFWGAAASICAVLFCCCLRTTTINNATTDVILLYSISARNIFPKVHLRHAVNVKTLFFQ